jgi:hypothetical protein
MRAINLAANPFWLAPTLFDLSSMTITHSRPTLVERQSYL